MSIPPVAVHNPAGFGGWDQYSVDLMMSTLLVVGFVQRYTTAVCSRCRSGFSSKLFRVMFGSSVDLCLLALMLPLSTRKSDYSEPQSRLLAKMVDVNERKRNLEVSAAADVRH